MSLLKKSLIVAAITAAVPALAATNTPSAQPGATTVQKNVGKIPSAANGNKHVSTELYLYNLTGRNLEVTYSDQFPVGKAGNIFLEAPQGQTVVKLPADKKDTPIWAFEMEHASDNHVTGTFKIGIEGSTQPNYFNYNIGYNDGGYFVHWAQDPNPQLVDLEYNGQPLSKIAIASKGKNPPCPLISNGGDDYTAVCTIAIVPHPGSLTYGYAPAPVKQ